MCDALTRQIRLFQVVPTSDLAVLNLSSPLTAKDFTVALKPRPSQQPILRAITVVNVDGNNVPVRSLSNAQGSTFIPELGIPYTFRAENPDQQVRVITIEAINVLDVDSKPDKAKVFGGLMQENRFPKCLHSADSD